MLSDLNSNSISGIHHSRFQDGFEPRLLQLADVGSAVGQLFAARDDHQLLCQLLHLLLHVQRLQGMPLRRNPQSHQTHRL
jgi:hypothetical protein